MIACSNPQFQNRIDDMVLFLKMQLQVDGVWNSVRRQIVAQA
jgi:hypothetical protein